MDEVYFRALIYIHHLQIHYGLYSFKHLKYTFYFKICTLFVSPCMAPNTQLKICYKTCIILQNIIHSKTAANQILFSNCYIFTEISYSVSNFLN